jgi:hypothetical protein
MTFYFVRRGALLTLGFWREYSAFWGQSFVTELTRLSAEGLSKRRWSLRVSAAESDEGVDLKADEKVEIPDEALEHDMKLDAAAIGVSPPPLDTQRTEQSSRAYMS